MKTATKFLLIAAVLGTLGLGGIARTVYASQSKPTVAIVPHHSTSIQIAEVSDGDGEVPDTTETSEATPEQQSIMNKTQVAQKQASDDDEEAEEASDDDEEAEEAEEDEATEASHPLTSISVPNTDAEDKEVSRR